MSGKSAIVFIDGNNLYHNSRESGIKPSSIDLLKLCEEICKKYSVVRKKTFYYNSVPSISDGKEKYFKHMSFLEDVKKLPNFEVETRKLQRFSLVEIQEKTIKTLEDLGLCERCGPKVEEVARKVVGDVDIHEKGIDVKIVCDMIREALNGNCDFFFLVSGDADFIPAMELIKSLGKKVISASFRKGYSSEIRSKQTFMYLDNIIDDCLKEKYN